MSADREIELNEYPATPLEERLADAIVNLETTALHRALAGIEARLEAERDAIPEAGTQWHRGARAGIATALDIVREATS